MNRELLVASWKREEQRPFSGWDFSYLNNRMLEEQPDWSYPARAIELLKQSSSVIDLDTGGGERFLELREHWPQRVVVTENYEPNFKLVTERLVPLGVKVVQVHISDFDPMPFLDGEFDLVLNRHAPFNASEVARLLSPGGTFLTQQVHGLWAHDLLAAFDTKPQWPEATLDKYVPRLKEAGLKIIDTRDWSGRLMFTEVGAIVYFLKAVPWLVPGFSVETHLKYLLALHEQVENQKPLSFVSKKYLIEARKANSAS